MNKKILTLLAIVIVILSGCRMFQSNDSELITGEVIEILPEKSGEDMIINIEDKNSIVVDDKEKDSKVSVSKDESKSSDNSLMIKVEGVEGDLMTLKPDAYDPDGDIIRYTFTEPFDENGLWQTVEGDAGEYVVTVTATDGRLSTSEDVLVLLKPMNKAPVIVCDDKIVLKETEKVEIECDISDPEGSTVEVAYLGWMNSPDYQTTYDDSGEYVVSVSASDGDRSAVKEITIIVENVNRAPVVEELTQIVVEETETVEVEVVSSDPDDDELTFEYSELFDENGNWETALGDAGTFDAYVIVSDGEESTKEEFQVVVTLKNTYPTLEFIEAIEVDEGDTITLPINTYDREGDELTITISGFFETEEYTTSFEDAGEHSVLVTVSDGELTASQEVEIIVNDVNRPPVFKIPA